MIIILLGLLGSTLLLLPRVVRLRSSPALWGAFGLIVGAGGAALLGVLGALGILPMWLVDVAAGVAALATAAALHLVTLAQAQEERANELERRRAEGLFHGAPEAIVLVDLDRRILEVNRAFSRLFGYVDDEVRGRPIDELLAPPERVEEAREISRVVNAGGTVNLDTVRRRKDGSLVEVAILVNRIAMGGGNYAIHGIYLDLTSRKAAERRLRENEALLELFFAQSLDGFFFAMTDAPIVWGPEVDQEAVLDWAIHHTRVTKVNDAMRLQYGATPDQLLGRTTAEFFAERTEEARRNLRELFDRGWSHAESRERRMDGTPILIEGDYRLLQDEDGRILGHFGIQRDITSRRRAEEEIRASRRQLRELAARLQAVREEERAVLAREVHDELGQLLTALKFEVSWMRQHLGVEAHAARARLEATLALIAEGVASVRRIITSLRPSLLDDLGLVAAVEWQVREFGGRTGLAAHFIPPTEDIAPDPGQATTLFRICQEALTNVARHAEAGEVRVTLGAIEGALQLEVRDDGRGFAPAEGGGAAGLGIVGMRERAIASGGSLRIDSGPGRGTVVSVLVPLKPSAPFEPVSHLTSRAGPASQ